MSSPCQLEQHVIIVLRLEGPIAREARNLQPSLPQRGLVVRQHPRDPRPMRCPQERFPIIRGRDIECHRCRNRPLLVEAIQGDLEDLIDDALDIVVDDVVAEDVTQIAGLAAGLLGPDEPNEIGPVLEFGNEIAMLGSGVWGKVVVSTIHGY